ncbi:MAG TPA: sensor histidine kinase [Ferruginibacter sp.]|nr:sensor histidine kinase [Ferruginibacter sp.]
MFNDVHITYVIVIFVTGAVLLAAIYHTILYLHRRTRLLSYYSTYLWFTSFYVLLRFINPSDIDNKYPLSFLNPDETLQMLAFAMYIRFMGLAMDLDPVKEKYAFFFWHKSKYLILTYVIIQMFAVNNPSLPYVYFILKISIRAYLLFLGLYFVIAIMLKRKEQYYYYLSAGAIAMIFFGIISSLSNLIQIPFFVLGALAWLMIGFFVDVIFFSSAIGYRIRTEAMEKENALKTVLEQQEILQQKEIEKLHVREQERSRIAKDLHDDIGSTLSSIHVYSSVASKSMDKDAEKARDALQHINENSRRVLDTMSDIVWAMKTNEDGVNSLEGKLKNYGYELLTPLGINCNYIIDQEAEKKISNMAARKNILLIIKEAINNIAKYSEATASGVSITLKDAWLLLEIYDDGKGFAGTGHGRGNGLQNMKERARDLGGALFINSEEGKGTRITCEIPITTISNI